MVNIKLYDIHGKGPLENCKTLITDDKEYFYWDNKPFKKNSLGDIVFWVNRKEKIAYHTIIDAIDLQPYFESDKLIIDDLGYRVYVVSSDPNRFQLFYRFKIIEIETIPDNWIYKNISPFNGQIMAIKLYEKNFDEPAKKIEKIEDLKVIFVNNESTTAILNTSIMLLKENRLKNKKHEPRVWFVTQGDSFTQDRGMKFLWAPKIGKDGSSKFYWTNVSNVKKGDIIFNYSNKELRGVSLAKSNGYDSFNLDTDSPWQSSGYQVDIDLTKLIYSFSNNVFKENVKKFDLYLSSLTNKPFTQEGKINQGYLYEFTKEAGRLIRDLYGENFGNKVIDDFFDNVNLTIDNSVMITNSNDFINSNLNIITAIKTKPFLLLAGISGTGKSRLVRSLAYQTCNKESLQSNLNKPGNFELIPVKPNWHDSTELLGYVSRINGEKYIVTTFLKFLVKAWQNLDVPFFLCLDEMNLAPVEQYFAEFLSIIETRQSQLNNIETDFLISKSNFQNENLYNELLLDLGIQENSKFENGISIPSNLVVIGTVNMDETAHSFSRKVLDRAMTFEINNVDLRSGLEISLNDWEYPQRFINIELIKGDHTSGSEVYDKFNESKKVVDVLMEINEILEGTPFKIAFRVRDEFLIYCYYYSSIVKETNWIWSALDDLITMKILSRIEGDESKTNTILGNLLTYFDQNFPKSNSKVLEMQQRLFNNGYTSFWA